MLVNRKIIFDAVKQLRGGQGYTPAEVKVLDAAIDAAIIQPVAPKPPPLLPTVGKFALSQASKDKLAPVHPTLRKCVELAITLSIVDFKVLQGLRTIEEQRKAVASGNSRTMKSKHLKQADGLVWAVDLGALIDGKISWDLNHYAAIAYAMDQAATKLGVADHIRWGCAWDRVLSDYGGEPKLYMAEVHAYAKRHPGKDLIDGPHFEWVE